MTGRGRIIVPVDATNDRTKAAVRGGARTRAARRLQGEDVGRPARLSRLCKALGHPARVKIVEVLLDAETCVCGDIAARLPLAQSTVSQHLKVLKEAGIVEGVIDGPRTCYGLKRRALAELRDVVAELV